jgi:subtilisin family serine protease
MAVVGAESARVTRADLVSVLIETPDADKLLETVPAERPEELVEKLTEGIVSAQLGLDSVDKVLKLPHVDRVQSKKRSQPHLTAARLDIGITAKAAGPRQVAETGKDVLIGVIDSGFDLTHPMFLDAAGKPRVEGLLVQNDDGSQKEFSGSEVAAALAAGTNPGADLQGHGTHVASIAGGLRSMASRGSPRRHGFCSCGPTSSTPTAPRAGSSRKRRTAPVSST